MPSVWGINGEQVNEACRTKFRLFVDRSFGYPKDWIKHSGDFHLTGEVGGLEQQATAAGLFTHRVNPGNTQMLRDMIANHGVTEDEAWRQDDTYHSARYRPYSYHPQYLDGYYPPDYYVPYYNTHKYPIRSAFTSFLQWPQSTYQGVYARSRASSFMQQAWPAAGAMWAAQPYFSVGFGYPMAPVFPWMW